MIKSLFVFVLGVLSALYLLNPGAGIFDIVPDNIPGVGNLDEATATLLLINSLAYFGIDMRRFFKRDTNNDKPDKTKLTDKTK
jgi:hypothetical protein